MKWHISQNNLRYRTKDNTEEKIFFYCIFNKPYSVLCQFTDKKGRKTLSNYLNLPKDVYPVGRLDADSEGLVFLTNDGKMKQHLLNPEYCHPRRYFVQVERTPSIEALQNLREGIIIESRKTLPAEIRLLEQEPDIPPRPVPIRFRKKVPTSWLEIIIYEGKNRQIRKMTAAAGHPTLRLVRTGIGLLKLNNLQPGEWRELTNRETKELKSSPGQISG